MFPAFEPLRIQGVQRVLILSTAPGPRAFKRRVLIVSMNVGSMAEAAGIVAGFHGGRKL